MDHDDDVRPFRQRQPVATLLIAAVAEISLVGQDDGIGKRPGEGRGVIATRVIDHNNGVHDFLGHDLVECLDEGFCRVIGRHDNDHFFTSEHMMGNITKGNEGNEEESDSD